MRTPRAAAAPLLLALAIAPAAADDAAEKNREGNRLYEKRQYDEALKAYTDAQASRPQAPELHYNIGNVLYRKGELDKALEEYLRAQAAPDRGLSQAAMFNRGNALAAQGRLGEAAGAYIQALKARPDDRDAKRNLELVLRMMQEQQKQPPESGDREPEDRKEPERKPPPQAGGMPPPDEVRRKPQPAPGAMSEEEARRILDALRDEEKEGIRRHARAAVPQDRQPEKDW